MVDSVKQPVSRKDREWTIYVNSRYTKFNCSILQYFYYIRSLIYLNVTLIQFNVFVFELKCLTPNKHFYKYSYLTAF